MMDQLFSDPAVQRRSCTGPLAPHLDLLVEVLRGEGYASATVKQRMRVVGRFSRWLDHRQLGIAQLSEETVERFFRQGGNRDRSRNGEAAALRQLISILRAQGLAPPLVSGVGCSEREIIEGAFTQYLVQERALQLVTQRDYLALVRRFLDARFGARGLDLGSLGSRDVSDFMLRYAQRHSRGSAKLMVAALRSFLRFLYAHGHIARDLAAAVPAVASWRLSNVPRSLESTQVERLLRGCERRTATGRRDHAVLLVLARLGLRGGEVVRMTLDDIDWDAGVLTVRGKGTREDRLPIPEDVGKALATYLRRGRPQCPTRRVFVRLRAPLRGLAGSATVSGIVRYALERVGLDPPCKGAHLLRHSLATRMLARHASLAEIGTILRHRAVDTTQIYAKVDLRALRTLALPWPGWPGGGR